MTAGARKSSSTTRWRRRVDGRRRRRAAASLPRGRAGELTPPAVGAGIAPTTAPDAAELAILRLLERLVRGGLPGQRGLLGRVDLGGRLRPVRAELAGARAGGLDQVG